jgi:hypothetical protein
MHAGTHGRLNDGLRGGALSNRAMFCETALCPHATSSSVGFRGQNGLGIAQMQRAYALRRKSGDLIFLFEDRALATLLKTSLFGDEILRQTLRHGRAFPYVTSAWSRAVAVFSVSEGRAQDWAALSRTLDRQSRLWRHARDVPKQQPALL